MTLLMPFQTSKMKLARAGHHADMFHAWAAAGDDAEALKASFRSFVRELRAALDSTIVDIARVRALDPENVRFPFAESAQQLSDLIDVEIRRIDEELAEHLKSLRLHKGGNRLYLLCEFAAAPMPDEAMAPMMDELFEAVSETVAELGARFWARP